MTTLVRRSAPSLALLFAAALCAAGCELFASLEPCTPGHDEECLPGESCGVDGFCRVVDGGVARDAGLAVRDAGVPDAGADAGVPDAGGEHDAGASDGGAPATDAGRDDAGTGPSDAGDDAGVDAGPTAACGNGVLNVDESCDDGRRDDGDGCDVACQQEPGWLCTGAPSTCRERCGDGAVVGAEQCDEGAANSDSQPDACRTDCTQARCGDGVIDADLQRAEVCDGAALGGLYCLERGFLPGSPSSCDASCADLDVARCGDAIDSTTDLRAALLAASARDAESVIALQPGDYIVDATVVVDDAVAPVHGVVLAPLGDVVVRLLPQAGFTGALLELASAGNRVERLQLVGASTAIAISAPDNVVERSLFRNPPDVIPGDLVLISAPRVSVRHNRFWNDSGQIGGRAIHASDEDGLRIERNLVHGSGSFLESFRIVGAAATSSRVTQLAHNTIDVTGNVVALYLAELGQLCAHNNVIRGNTPTRGLSLFGTVTLGDAARCGVLSQQNAVVGMSDRCSGDACEALCEAPGPLCALSDAPGFDANGCLSTTSALLDVGADVGVPPADADGAALPYTGAGVDVGAREAGTSTAHGGVTSTCPAP